MSIMSRTTVRQVLDDIQIRLPHTYNESSLFLWINETMKKIYKDLAIQNKYSFTTRAGQKQYVLPQDCSIDMIDGVTISEKARDQNNPYDWGNFNELISYLPNNEMTDAGYYDGREGTIGIYPEPKDVRKVDIYYRKKPQMVTSLDDYIELDDNYVDLVKYNLMNIIALSGHNPDIELANEYILLYNNLVQKANENKNEQQQRCPVIRNVVKYKRRR
nr:MAG TPA: hypothetical protein [Caudoviricetes sp.]